MAELPLFQEATRCDVCKCSFNTFRRRHHCRCCGRTLCSEHSSKQVALPQFGISSAVRVCDDCFNSSTQSATTISQTASNDVDAVANTFSRFDLAEDSIFPSECQNSSSVEDSSSVSQGVECKCGMPLCICEAPAPPQSSFQAQPVVASASNYQRPKKVITVPHTSSNAVSKASASSSGNNRPSLFFAGGQANNGNLDQLSQDYETSEEGLREAIKKGDVSAVKGLLMHGVNVNYCDKQGMSLLHLATVFNFTEIAFLLMDAGASVDAKNAQGETPLDCAQTMLQYKMRKKIEEAVNI